MPEVARPPRLCGHCRADLDELDKRPHAVYCGGACRAAASRERDRRASLAAKAHSALSGRRKRGIRKGVTTYFPTVASAKAALQGTRGQEVAAARAAAKALNAAIGRRQARGRTS